MRILGCILVIMGVAWMAMCFLGIAMMSHSVGMFTEVLLPSVLGFLPIGLGLWLICRKRSAIDPPAA